jgi:transglutaminase-like putative cysteine protease
MEKPAAVKAAIKQDQPENSIEMRAVCGLMALLSVGMACAYTHCAPIPVFIYLWLTMAGCYVSYHQRNTRNLLNTLLTVIGLIVVLGMFAAEMWSQFNTIRLEVLIPFIHVLTGLLALHTFDLRTRVDLNTNCLIGVGLLACTLVLGRDLTSGIVVFCYAWLAASLFYLDSSSRTRSYGRFTPTEPSSPSRMAMHRESAGYALLPISAIPLLGLFFFLCLPRVNSIFDMLVDKLSHPFATVSMAPAGPSSSPGPGGANGPGSGNSHGYGYGSGSGTGHGVMDTGAHSKVMDTQSPGKASKAGIPSAMPPEAGGVKTGKGGKSTGQKGAATIDTKSAQDQGPPDEELVMRDKEAAKYDDQLLFEVNAPGDFYYRRLVFDTYNGKTWSKAKEGTLSKCRKLSGGLYQELGGVPSLFLPEDLRTTAVIQEITVRKPMGHVIFGVTLPQKIDFPIDPVIVDDNGVIRTAGLLKPGMTYRVYSVVPSYNLDTMRKAVDDPAAQDRALKEYSTCLTVPTVVPEEVKELAKNVAGTDGNWFVKSERICKFLRSNYRYSNEGADTPPDPAQDLVDYFLFGARKEGACGPFASAFTVMCREVGIPARVIGGFAPGDYNGVSGLREVHGKHGHAWAEVYIPRYGWVPFDATPSGVLPAPPEEDNSFMGTLSRSLGAMEAAFNPSHPTTTTSAGSTPTTGNTAGAPRPGSSNPIPLPAVEKNSTGTSNSAAPLPTGKTAADQKDTAASKSPLEYFKKPETQKWWFLLLEGLMILGIIPMTLLLAQAIRAGYLQFKAKTYVDKTAKPSTVLYLRVVDDLKRFKISRSPSDTAHDISQRFLTAVEGGMPVHSELPGALKLFIQKYTDDRFGAPEESELRRQELQEIGDKIHTLVRTRVS